MKKIGFITALLGASLFIMNFQTIKNLFSDKKEIASRTASTTGKGSFHSFSATSIDGKKIDFSTYKGKKVVVLNVASKCGYTPQYADWQAFHEKYGDKVVVLGFPTNDFMNQEPGSEDQIATFCQKNYGVSFQMFSKVDVIKGNNQHPLYKWLSNSDLNGWNDKAPTWNFCKYVINEEGEVTHFFASGVLPKDPTFQKAVGL
ncbi:MAG: glutathione peroxidase [Spirosomataceae bacterium]